MKLQGKDLIFVSQIKRDGTGTFSVDESYIEMLKDEWFSVRCLSISQSTFIANAFNSFVVRLVEKDFDSTPMNKAWNELNNQSWANNDDVFQGFREGWNAASKHFNSKTITHG